MAPAPYVMKPGDYFAVGLGLTGWTSMYVGLRFYCRFMFRIPLGTDDICCVLAYVMLLGINIATGVLYLGPNGMTVIDGNLVAQNPHEALSAYYANHIMYFISMFFCKLAVIFLCIRLFTSTAFRVSAGVVGFFCLAAFIGGMVPFAVGCAPNHIISTTAGMGVQLEYKCENMVPLFQGVNLSNFFTNLMCLCLPLPWVWQLKLTTKQRIALSALFLVGGIGCLISLLRVFLQNSWNDSFDTMVGNCSMWSVIEPAVCLFAACLPTLRPLLPSNFIKTGNTQQQSVVATAKNDPSIVKAQIVTSPPPVPPVQNRNDPRRQVQYSNNIGFTQSYAPPPPPSQSTYPASVRSEALKPAVPAFPAPPVSPISSVSYNRNNSYRTDRRPLRQQVQLQQHQQQQPQQQTRRQSRYWQSVQQAFDRRPSLSNQHGRSWLSDEPNTPPQSYYDRGNTF